MDTMSQGHNPDRPDALLVLRRTHSLMPHSRFSPKLAGYG
jgi:hypothetical protein